MENDRERSEAIHNFYEIYKPLSKRYNLRMNSHFSIYQRDQDYIEIYEYSGDTRGARICLVKEDEEIDCYRKAAEEMKNYGRKKSEEKGHERKAG
jgi:hypothetical protein